MSVISFGPEFREALTVGPFTHDRYDSDDVLGDTPFKHRRSGDYDTGVDSPVKLRPAQSAPAADLSYAPPTPGGRAFRRQVSASSAFDDDDYDDTGFEAPALKNISNTELGDDSAPAVAVSLDGRDIGITAMGDKFLFSFDGERHIINKEDLFSDLFELLETSIVGAMSDFMSHSDDLTDAGPITAGAPITFGARTPFGFIQRLVGAAKSHRKTTVSILVILIGCFFAAASAGYLPATVALMRGVPSGAVSAASSLMSGLDAYFGKSLRLIKKNIFRKWGAVTDNCEDLMFQFTGNTVTGSVPGEDCRREVKGFLEYITTTKIDFNTQCARIMTLVANMDKKEWFGLSLACMALATVSPSVLTLGVTLAMDLKGYFNIAKIGFGRMYKDGPPQLTSSNSTRAVLASPEIELEKPIPTVVKPRATSPRPRGGVRIPRNAVWTTVLGIEITEVNGNYYNRKGQLVTPSGRLIN